MYSQRFDRDALKMRKMHFDTGHCVGDMAVIVCECVCVCVCVCVCLCACVHVCAFVLCVTIKAVEMVCKM